MYINAIAHYIPDVVLPNAHYEKITSRTHEWLVARTGIHERRRAGLDENTNTMALKAAQMLAEKLPFSMQEFDLIISGSYTPYDTVITPSHYIQHHLDISDAAALMISSACSTFLNGMEVAEGYIASGKAQKALVVLSEHNSAYNDDQNEASGHLWGDASVALSISKNRLSEQDVQVVDLITGGGGHIGKSMESVMLQPKKGEKGICMPNGRDVFINACQYMRDISSKLLDKNQLTIEDLRFFIPHQANFRISKNVAENLGLPEEKVVSNIQYLGNTGCAGSAIGISEKWDDLIKGDRLIISVFGGGYSYGAMLLEK